MNVESQKEKIMADENRGQIHSKVKATIKAPEKEDKKTQEYTKNEQEDEQAPEHSKEPKELLPPPDSIPDKDYQYLDKLNAFLSEQKQALFSELGQF